MKLIIDSDHLTYRSSASCSPTKAKPFQEGMQEAIWRMESMIEQIFMDLNSSDAEFYIGGEGNWRKDIYPEYKANRANAPKPLWLEDVREHLVLKYKAEIVNGKEVDDQCGIRLTQEGVNGICISLDKDLLTVPGYHYNFVKRTRIFVSPFDALRNFYKQVLTGDASDNVPSFDGMMRSKQPKFIEKLLEPIDEMTDELDMWEYVLDVFCSNVDSFAGNGHGYTLATRNARVLWIQKEENDQWQPPGQMLDGKAL